MTRRPARALLILALLATSCGRAAPPQPPPAPAPQLVDSIQVFLVALNDAGRLGQAIGCGDSLVAVRRQIKPTGAPLRAALEELLALPGPTVPGSALYNALYQSHLRVDRVSVVGGQARVELSGQTLLGGVCDSPRFVGQIDATVRQFPTVADVAVTVNGRPLADFLSEKGG